MQTLFTASAGFEAARFLPQYPEGHPFTRTHGHSFRARIRTPEVSVDKVNGCACESLQQRLQQCIAPFDYDLLNNHLANPDDAQLARWIGERMQIPAELIGIRSSANQGCDLETPDRMHIWRRYRFEAAHQLPNVPPGHQCGRMHGHGFEVILHANRSDERGPEFEYQTLDEHWAPLHEQLHHRCMNDIPGLENPTSEALSNWIWQRLKQELPELSWVTVYETTTAGCHYDGEHYRIWKEQRFESALSLPEIGLHGHSYLIRLHLTAPLDPVMCWTIDYGDVKEVFKPVYKQLDHHRLDQLPGIGRSDPEGVARWIKSQISDSLPELDRIDLYQQPGCGVILNWGEHGPALPT